MHLLIHILKTCFMQVGVCHHTHPQHYTYDISDSMPDYFVWPELLTPPYCCEDIYDDRQCFQLHVYVSLQRGRQTHIFFM